jgi:hypothetical protein
MMSGSAYWLPHSSTIDMVFKKDQYPGWVVNHHMTTHTKDGKKALKGRSKRFRDVYPYQTTGKWV